VCCSYARRYFLSDDVEIERVWDIEGRVCAMKSRVSKDKQRGQMSASDRATITAEHEEETILLKELKGLAKNENESVCVFLPAKMDH
jgi:hypothetical protein